MSGPAAAAKQPARPEQAHPRILTGSLANGRDLAADLTRTRENLEEKLQQLAFERLWVLVLAASGLGAACLASIVARGKKLRKLDVSHCALASVPPAAWADLKLLAVVFMHRNHIGHWSDVRRVLAAPNLAWLTMFDNPIGGQPQFRSLAIGWGPQLSALDLWVVTDGERLWYRKGAHQQGHGFETHEDSLADPAAPAERSDVPAAPLDMRTLRFGPFAPPTMLNLAMKPRQRQADALDLLRAALAELTDVHVRGRVCSAAAHVQRAWTAHRLHNTTLASRALQERSVKLLQRNFRKLHWKVSMLLHLKKYLAEVGEPELLLDTKEMLRLRAARRIEATFKCIIQKRRERKKTRAAATLICRCIRGWLTRVRLQHEYFKLDTHLTVYFPETCLWEFLALLNVARSWCRLPPLPRYHKFEAAEIMAVRLPDLLELRARSTSILRLLAVRNTFLVRPCHSGRFSDHLWDGPLHAIKSAGAPPMINQAHAVLCRRAAAVNNHCRLVFFRSCVLGAHPINTSRLPRPPRCEDTALDFRDIWEFGTKLGDGALGMAFLCHKREGNHRKSSCVVRLNEHHKSWWGAFGAPKEAQWKMLAKEMEIFANLDHPNITKIKDIFVDDSFAYFVMERHPSNLAAISFASRSIGHRGLPAYVVGEIVLQMLKAVAYLHSHQVVHRDIRAENCFVDTSQLIGRPFRVVLSDLNSALRLEAGILLKEPLGVPEYWAPEVIAGEYAHEADVWSVGVVLWFLLTTRLPFTEQHEIINTELTRQVGISDDPFNLVEKVLAKSCKQRATAAEAEQHRWLQTSSARHRQDLLTGAADQTFGGGTGGALNDDANQGAMMTKRKAKKGAAGEDSVFRGSLWMVKHDGDNMNPDDWHERDFWLTQTGSLMYSISWTNAAVMMFSLAGVRSASIKKVVDRRGKPFVFAVKVQGDSSKEFATETAEQRESWLAAFERFSLTGRGRTEKKQRADQRYLLGEKVAIRLTVALDRWYEGRAARDREVRGWRLEDHSKGRYRPWLRGSTASGRVDVEKYAWWMEDACRSRGLPSGSLSPPAPAPPEATPLRTPPESPTEAPAPALAGSLQTADGSLVWPETPGCLRQIVTEWCGEEVFERWPVEDALENLHKEVSAHRCQLQVVQGRLCRVFHRIVIRVQAPSGAYLVATEIQRGRSKGKPDLHRLPAIPWHRVGSGPEQVMRHVRKLMENEIHAPLEVIQVHLVGGLQHDDVLEHMQPSEEYPGLFDKKVDRFFFATVQTSVKASHLQKLGIPGELPFETVNNVTRVGTSWHWRSKEWCLEHGLPIEQRAPPPPELEGFAPATRFSLDRARLLDLLRQHDINPDYFGVGRARSISKLLHEMNHGEVQLRAHPEKPADLRRYVEIVELQIRSACRALLVKTVHSFGKEDDGSIFHGLPETVLGAFEDAAGAARRLLQSLDVPYATAQVHVGPARMDQACDAAYPGMLTVRARRTVEVLLREPRADRCEGTRSFRWSMAPVEGDAPGEAQRPTGEASSLTMGGIQEGVPVSPILQELLEGPESKWPAGAQCVGSPLQQFFREARRLGSRPCASPRRPLQRNPQTGAKCYRDEVWLNERMLRYRCDSTRLVDKLVSVLLRFRGTGGDEPLVRPVPFLLETSAREVAAVVCIQAAFKAHLTRARLKICLRTVVTVRRAATCVQHAWIWSLLTHRFRLLEGCAAFVKDIKTNVLYMEERLLLSLNLVNNVNRFAPMMPERALGFGYCKARDKLVLVCRSKRMQANLPHGLRESGLPRWLMNATQQFEIVEPDDPSLVSTTGLHGLFLMGSADTDHPYTVTVNMPSLQQAAQVEEKMVGHSGVPPRSALTASSGCLRFIEVRFRNLTQARRHAMLLYLCTYSSRHRRSVPLVPKSMLQSPALFDRVLRLWEDYGLLWPQGDRSAHFQVRQRLMRSASEVIPMCGRESWQAARSMFAQSTHRILEEVKPGDFMHTVQIGAGNPDGRSGMLLPPVASHAAVERGPRPPQGGRGRGRLHQDAKSAKRGSTLGGLETLSPRGPPRLGMTPRGAGRS